MQLLKSRRAKVSYLLATFVALVATLGAPFKW
jgi:hypothetical protein